MAARTLTGDSTVIRRVALTICWPGSGATLAIGKRKSERLRLPPAFVPTNSVAPLPLLVDVPSSKLWASERRCGRSDAGRPAHIVVSSAARITPRAVGAAVGLALGTLEGAELGTADGTGDGAALGTAVGN
jgi:hypothetical protein